MINSHVSSIVGLIDIEGMQSVIKGFFFFFFSKIARPIILVIWKPCDREILRLCLSFISD